MKMKKPNINWPWLDFRLRLPFIHIETMVMYQRFESYTQEYIALWVTVWKWDWRFRLYRPGTDHNRSK